MSGSKNPVKSTRSTSIRSALRQRPAYATWTYGREAAITPHLLYLLVAFPSVGPCSHFPRENHYFAPKTSTTLLDWTPIIPVTACHQRNYVKTYSTCSVES